MKQSRIDIYNNDANNINNINNKKTKKKLKKSVKILIAILIFIFLSSYFIITYAKEIAIGNIKTNEYNIESEYIASSFHGTKIVHFSDIHYGTVITSDLLEKIVDDINLTKPDIVIFTGDLFDDDATLDSKSIDELSQILNKIKSVYGKYAIKGDNDYNENWNMIIENSGFIDISDSFDCIYNEEGETILLSGISSNIKNKIELKEKLTKTYEFLESNDISYSVLAIHEPDIIDALDISQFNLILAGHTLGGEVKLPIIGGTNYPILGEKYTKSQYNIDSTTIFVSNGLGTSSLKMRLFNSPSFNLYRLIKK